MSLLLSFLLISAAQAAPISTSPSPIVADCVGNLDQDVAIERAIAVSAPAGLTVLVIDDRVVVPLTLSPLQVPVVGRGLVCDADVVSWGPVGAQPELAWSLAATITQASPIQGICYGDLDGDRLSDSAVLVRTTETFGLLIIGDRHFTAMAAGTYWERPDVVGVSCATKKIIVGVEGTDFGLLMWHWNGKAFVEIPEVYDSDP